MDHKKILIIIFLAIVPLNIHANDLPDCNVSTNRLIHFSNQSKQDKLLVTIIGSPCYKAQLNLLITSPEDKIIYEYSAPFKRHTAINWKYPKLDEIAAELSTSISGHRDIKLSSEFPEWLPNDQYYEEHYETIQVSKDYYELLRKSDWSVFSHSNHYEGWQVLVFDPNQQKAVLVLSGAL